MLRENIKLFKNKINPLTPNDHYSGRTAPLTSKHCILYIYSTNIGTEYFNMVYTLQWQEDEEENVGSYWMTLRKGEDTHIWRRKLKIALCGELDLEEVLDLS